MTPTSCDVCCTYYDKKALSSDGPTGLLICKSCSAKAEKCNHCSADLGPLASCKQVYTGPETPEVWCDECAKDATMVAGGTHALVPKDKVSVTEMYGAVAEWDLIDGECEACGESLLKGYSVQGLKEGAHACLCCIDTAKAGKKNWSFVPKLKFLTTGSDDVDPPMGIELETNATQNGTSPYNIIAVHQKSIPDAHKATWYYKLDSSILKSMGGHSAPMGAAEFVSHPMTLGYAKKLKKQLFTKPLSKLESLGCEAATGECCGMHVHIGINKFSTEHLVRYMGMIYENPDFALEISQRGQLKEMEKYCPPHPSAFVDTQDVEYKEAAQQIKDGEFCGEWEAHHVAVMLTGKNTVELRIFRGTLNSETVIKNLEAVTALYWYTKGAENPTPAGFWKWVDGNPKNAYPSLTEWKTGDNTMVKNKYYGDAPVTKKSAKKGAV